MKRTAALIAAVGGGCLLYGTVVQGQSALTVIEQNGRAGYKVVSRVAVGQGSSRSIRLTGKWLHLVASATTTGGVSARMISKTADHQVKMVLDASAGSARGNLGLRLNITCPPPIPFVTADCTSAVTLPVKVLETGPMTTITPSGNVPANAVVTFNVTTAGASFAKPMARFLTLKNATIVSRTSTVISVRGTTPACGGIGLDLQDESQLDEEVSYRRGTGFPSVLAGGVFCQGTLPTPPPTTTTCPVGTTWNSTLKACQDE